MTISDRVARTGICLLLWPALLQAAELQTEHTWRLADGERSPEASLEDATWLVGSWSGTAFGGRFEEVWNPPSAGSMVGMFKLFGDDGVAMYELMAMTIEDGTLTFRVRHFDPDFTAWEGKDEDVSLPLVRKDPDALHFGPVSFFRRDDDRIDAYVVSGSGATIAEQQIIYQRRESR